MTTRKNLVGQIREPGLKPRNVDLVVQERPVLTESEREAGIQSVDGRYEFGNVKRYFAAGDGSTDDTAAFENWASAGKGSMVVPPGTYKLDTATGLNFNTGSRIIGYGATLDFSSADPANSRLRFHGSIGDELTLSGNVDVGDGTIPLDSVSGLAVGDLLLISSDDLVPLDDIGGSTTETIGEFIRIKDIDSLDVIIDGYLNDAYTTADNAKVQKITANAGSTVEGLRIVGTGTDSSSTLEIGISALYATDFHVKSCRFRDVDYQNVALDQCYVWSVEKCHIEIEYRGAAEPNIIQYGIAPKNASSRGRIVGNNITGGKHGIVWTENVLDGIGRDVYVGQNTIKGTWHAAISTHESNEEFKIDDNTVDGCERGIEARVQSGEISRNRIRNIPQGASIGDAIFLSENAKDLKVFDNQIDGARYGIKMYNGGLPTGARPERISIRDNSIKNINQVGIYLEHTESTAVKQGIVVADNDIVDCAGDFIRLNGAFLNAVVRGNNCLEEAVASSGFGVRVMGTTGTVIDSNHFDGMTPVRLEVDDQGTPATPSGPVLKNNTYTNTDAAFLSNSASTDRIVSNNVPTAVDVATGTYTLLGDNPYTEIDSSGGAVSGTLGNGPSPGFKKIIVMTDASNSSTVSVNVHETSSPEVFTFAQTTDKLTLEWDGSQWWTVKNIGVAT